MKKIELNIVGLSYSQAQSNSYALVLGEANGKRRLPIVIGHYEAQAIALEIEKMKPSRPLTHDLFYNFAKIYGINIVEVQITKFHEGIFYATLICDNGISIHEIDSRTSDAVALSIRFHCPIYTTEEIMSQAGILFEDEPKMLMTQPVKTFPITCETSAPPSLRPNFRWLLMRRLQKASLIRDEIRKRK